MNNLIELLLKSVPDDNWIRQQSHLPWLQVHLTVPIEQILSEANELYSQSVLHRSSEKFANYQHQGWRSLTIFGDAPDITEETDGSKNWTSIADQCPATVQFIKNYWEIDDTTGRIRFMWVDPNGYILPHRDSDRHGFYATNIAITQPEKCVFRFLEYGNVPFKPGAAFLVDTSNRHLVANDSNQSRLHVIVHSKLKPGIIQQSYAQNFYS
jgi:hypothetical protein